jgi:hypothetical protein
MNGKKGCVGNQCLNLPNAKESHSIREIVIVSPFITRKRLLQMLTLINAALENKVKVVAVTRQATDYRDKQSITETLGLLQVSGITGNLQIKYPSEICGL